MTEAPNDFTAYVDANPDTIDDYKQFADDLRDQIGGATSGIGAKIMVLVSGLITRTRATHSKPQSA